MKLAQFLTKKPETKAIDGKKRAILQLKMKLAIKKIKGIQRPEVKSALVKHLTDEKE